MFRATMFPSSGENIVPLRHLPFVTLNEWLSGMQGRPCIPDSHLYRITSTKCRIDTVISPDDGHSCPKHAEKSNKHIKKICAPSWFYLQKIISPYQPIIRLFMFEQLTASLNGPRRRMCMITHDSTVPPCTVNYTHVQQVGICRHNTDNAHIDKHS